MATTKPRDRACPFHSKGQRLETAMSASRQPSWFQFLGFRDTRNLRGWHDLGRNSVLSSLGTLGLALSAFLLVLNLRAAGQDAQRASSMSSVVASATSLNGPGDLFLTANVIVNPGGGAPGS